MIWYSYVFLSHLHYYYSGSQWKILGQCACVLNGTEIYVIAAHDDDLSHMQVFMFDLGIFTRLFAIWLFWERMRWTRVGIRGVAPAARGWQTCAVRGKIIYIFGGYSSGVVNDFWALDCGMCQNCIWILMCETEKKKWNQVELPELSRPSPRESHAMVMVCEMNSL